MKKRSILKKIALAVIVVIVAVYAAANAYLINYAFVRPSDGDGNDRPSKVLVKNQKWLSKQRTYLWEQKAVGTDIKLKAVYLPAETKTNKTIIVAHGYHGSSYNMQAISGCFTTRAITCFRLMTEPRAKAEAGLLPLGGRIGWTIADGSSKSSKKTETIRASDCSVSAWAVQP